MKKQFFSLIGACVMGVMLLAGAVSCEKMNVEDGDADARANVVLRIGSIEQVPFPVVTRATVEELCSHLCFHIYDDDGTRVDYVNQKVDDDHYGTATFLLDQGHYYLVVVGHSGSSNPSFKKGEVVSISGNNLGDTFWCCEEFDVEEDVVSLDLELTRTIASTAPKPKIPAFPFSRTSTSTLFLVMFSSSRAAATASSGVLPVYSIDFNISGLFSYSSCESSMSIFLLYLSGS